MISGKKLRLSGKGEPSPYGGQPGDLYIKSVILDDPQFALDNHDLISNHEIKLTQALLGTQITVATIDGKEMTLKIPPGTRHKTKMRLAGLGLPNMQGRARGDLYVIVNVQMPQKLTAKQKKIVDELADAGL